jgi:hypothetical protein
MLSASFFISVCIFYITDLLRHAYPSSKLYRVQFHYGNEMEVSDINICRILMCNDVIAFMSVSGGCTEVPRQTRNLDRFHTSQTFVDVLGHGFISAPRRLDGKPHSQIGPRYPWNMQKDIKCSRCRLIPVPLPALTKSGQMHKWITCTSQSGMLYVHKINKE